MHTGSRGGGGRAPAAAVGAAVLAGPWLVWAGPACRAGQVEPAVTAPASAPSSPSPGPGQATGGVVAGSPAPALNPSPGAAAAPATAGAGAGAAQGSCASGTWKICDDFESTPVGAAPDPNIWQTFVQQASSQVVVDDARFYRGSRSLHLSTQNSGYEQALLVNKTLFPAADNSFFGRAYVFLGGEVPQAHFNLVSGAGVLPGQQATTTLNYGGQFGLFLANYYNAQDPTAVLDLWQHAGVQAGGSWTDATAVPSRAWACLEWQFVGPTNQMRMWLNGQAVPRMSVDGVSRDCCPSSPWTQPTFTQVSMGWTIVANQESFSRFDLWLDGVALDSSRIGCEPAGS